MDMKEISLAEHLKAWQKRRKMTAPAAAMFLDVPISTYQKWIQGVSEPDKFKADAIRAGTK